MSGTAGIAAHIASVTKRAEDAEAERDGWRAENDRHRALYVDAVKERDQLRVIVGVLRADMEQGADLLAAHHAAAEAMGDSFNGKWLEPVHELVAERDRLRAVVDALREHRALVARLIGEDHEPEEEIGLDEAQWASWRRITEMLDQLDVSPAMGGDDVGR